MSEFGDRLAAALERVGVTGDQLANKAGVDQGTVSRIITGDTKDPKASTWVKLAATLGLTGDELLSGAAPKKSREQILAIDPARTIDASIADAVAPNAGDRDGVDREAVLREISRLHFEARCTSDEAKRAGEVVAEFHRDMEPTAGPAEVALGLVLAVRDRGLRASSGAILARYATGKRDAVQKARDAAADRDIAARGAAAHAKATRPRGAR
jgi:transcriptional regulator with XRE-family HTH domain